MADNKPAERTQNRRRRNFRRNKKPKALSPVAASYLATFQSLESVASSSGESEAFKQALQKFRVNANKPAEVAAEKPAEVEKKKAEPKEKKEPKKNSIVRFPFGGRGFRIPSLTIPDYLFKGIDEARAEQAAFIDGPTDRTYTFGQVKALSAKVATGLIALGLKKGDVICTFCPNIPEFPIAIFGALSMGAAVSSANPGYASRELEHQLKDSNSSYIITVAAFYQKVKEAADDHGGIKEIIVISETAVPEGAKSFKSLLDNDGVFAKPEIDLRNDVALLPYSSGTTGLPKGVMLTHHNVVANIMQCSHDKLINWIPGEKQVCFLPFFHIYGMVVCAMIAFDKGITTITMPKFDGVEFLTLIQKHKCENVPVVPPVALFLAKHPAVEKFDLSSMKELLIGAAPFGPEATALLQKRFPKVAIRQGYGMTELSPVTHITPLGPIKPGSIGVAVLKTDVQVIDLDTGKPLGPNKDGEVIVRGPQVMKGYLNKPEATAETVKGKWLHTGDIGHYDEDGFFFIVDRRKELIKYKGSQVAPAELEALLLGYDLVSDVAVIGVPDEEAGELPFAYVVKAKPELTAEMVNAFVDGKVASYKKLRGGVEFIDAIPKSASGKILRRVLKEQNQTAKL